MITIFCFRHLSLGQKFNYTNVGIKSKYCGPPWAETKIKEYKEAEDGIEIGETDCWPV